MKMGGQFTALTTGAELELRNILQRKVRDRRDRMIFCTFVILFTFWYEGGGVTRFLMLLTVYNFTNFAMACISWFLSRRLLHFLDSGHRDEVRDWSRNTAVDFLLLTQDVDTWKVLHRFQKAGNGGVESELREILKGKARTRRGLMFIFIICPSVLAIIVRAADMLTTLTAIVSLAMFAHSYVSWFDNHRLGIFLETGRRDKVCEWIKENEGCGGFIDAHAWEVLHRFRRANLRS